MRLIKKITNNTLSLPTLRLEGGLFLPDQLEKAALGKASQQSEADYQTPKGLKLKDDYSRAFQIAAAQWKHFAPNLEREDLDATSVTNQFVEELLRDALGYANLSWVEEGVTVGDRTYPITAIAGQVVPLVIAPHTLDLDDPDPRFAITGSGARKKSAFQLAQEFLNASGDHLWALVTNGKQLRLLRDAATLTRPSFLEFDLQDMLGGQRFAEFGMAWRLLHASRASYPSPSGRGAGGEGNCIWEAWRTAGQQEGIRVRDGLRQGVTDALLTLGAGFIQHPTNESLRRDLLEGRLTKEHYFQQLLRLVYRLIFLFTVEERGVLHSDDDSKQAVAACRAYTEGYALARLRDRCLRRRARNQFDDLWSGLRIVFRSLANGEPRLALPALGGLFAETQCPALDAATLSNATLLNVMRQLRWSNLSGNLAPVDYRNMGPEELGSVYESLLELVPEIDIPARQFGFVGLTSEGGTPESTRGNARKTSGSYYTPDSLVQELIKSALDPVIEQRLRDNHANPTDALLSIKVIDPACGSGHFLLAAARRLGERLAALRAPEGAIKPQDYRHALREVISRCIFGVDRNPMALELARTALWLEGFEEGLALSFLDHHLVCGDALIGITDLKQLQHGIPDAAFKPLSGDDKTVCTPLAKENKEGLKAFAKAKDHPQLSLVLENAAGLTELQTLEAMPDTTTREIARKEAAYSAFLQHARESRLAHAANLLVGAFLAPKGDASAHLGTPTSKTLYLELFSESRNQEHEARLAAAQDYCAAARVLHWPLAFPQVYARGGFDCVLGNPPWERIKLQEEEFFATRNRCVAEARNKAERGQRIDWLAQGQLAKHLYPELQHAPHECEAEQQLYREFIIARRTAEAASVFAHVKGEEGGRYPLTGVGDVNTYALFAETISQIVSPKGRAGFIVPTGIATDDSTKAYFSNMTSTGSLVELLAFENEEFIFSAVHHSFRFCLLVLAGPEQSRDANFVFFARQPQQIHDSRRRFTLSLEDFARISPNTLTCPVFRSRMDAELTRKIYQRVPVLIREAHGNQPEHNPWGIRFMAMFHMSNDSHLFADSGGDGMLPLYEAKMIHQFDHRWASYRVEEGKDVSGDVALADKQNPAFTVTPRYWVDKIEVTARLNERGWNTGWLMGFRDVTSAHVLRTTIVTVLPRVGVGHTAPLFSVDVTPEVTTALLANLNSMMLDFVARQKVGGIHLTYSYLKQFPILPPDTYTEADLAFIVPRVLELTYTAHDMQPWAQDLGYDGPPFTFDPDRRAVIRAELDTWYVRAYGLSLDELRYILDPADVMGADYPSETFRVLKNNEEREFGEYKTRTLVLREFNRLTLAERSGQPYQSLLDPPPGVQPQSTYSSVGVVRNADDARLAGFILSLIKAAQTLPRSHLSMAMQFVRQPARSQSYFAGDEIQQLESFVATFDSAGNADSFDRVNELLRYLEAEGLIRVVERGQQFEAVEVNTIPPGIQLASDMAKIAHSVLQAVAKHETILQQPSHDKTAEQAPKQA